MAGRYLRLLLGRGRARASLLVTGGLAADAGLLAALREAAAEQKAPVEVRSHPALGAGRSAGRGAVGRLPRPAPGGARHAVAGARGMTARELRSALASRPRGARDRRGRRHRRGRSGRCCWRPARAWCRSTTPSGRDRPVRVSIACDVTCQDAARGRARAAAARAGSPRPAWCTARASPATACCGS